MIPISVLSDAELLALMPKLVLAENASAVDVIEHLVEIDRRKLFVEQACGSLAEMAQEDRKIGRFEDGTEEVIGALIEVHRHLGPGLLESAYEACLCAELSERQLKFERQ